MAGASLMTPSGMLAGLQRLRVRFGTSSYFQWVLALFLVGFLVIPSTRHHRDFYYFLVLLPFLLVLQRSEWRALFASHTVRLTSLLLAYMVLTLSWSAEVTADDVYDHFRHALLMLSLVLIIAQVTQLNPRWLEDVFPLFVLAAVIVTAYSTFQFYQDNTFPYARLQNQMGIRDNPIGGSVPLVLIGLTCTAVSLADRNLMRRGLALFGAFSALVFLVLAQSRSLLLGFVIGLVILLVYLRAWRLLASAVGVGLLGLLALEFSEVFRGFLERADSYRFAIWSDALRQIGEKPWLGHGLNTPMLFDEEHAHTDSAHNMWLTVYLQGGLPGFLLYAGVMLTSLVWLLRSARSEGTYLFVALLGFTLVFTALNVHGLVGRFSPHLVTSVWLCIGLAAGVELRLRETHCRLESTSS